MNTLDHDRAVDPARYPTPDTTEATPGLDLDDFHRQVMEGVREADADVDTAVDAEAVANIAYEVLRSMLRAARERPSALDVEKLTEAVRGALADWQNVYVNALHPGTVAEDILARLTEPDAGEGTEPECTCDGYGGHARGCALNLDTTERVRTRVCPNCDCDCHIDPEMDPTVCDRCTGKSEQERSTPDTTEATLRAAGEGYEVRVWQRHEPSGVVVLPGHPQLGGRYCQTDGGDWPCATVRAALQQPAARPEHEHYWTDAPDDEEAWHCSICGLTTWATNPPYGSDSAAVQPERGPE